MTLSPPIAGAPRLKGLLRRSWPFVALVWLGLTYAATTLVLLRFDNADIAFTRRELLGISQYERVVAAYFDKMDKGVDSDADGVELRQSLLSLGDSSSLILDPVLQSYSEVDILFNHVPWLALVVGGKKDVSTTWWMRESEALTHNATVLTYAPGNDDVLLGIRRIQYDLAHSLFGAAYKNDLRTLTSAAIKHLGDLLGKRLIAQERYRFWSASIIAVISIFTCVFLALALRNYIGRKEIGYLREQQKLVRKLAQRSEELEVFTYAAAHDMKEPLRTMSCFARLLSDENKEGLSDESKEYTRIIENTARRAQAMIASLIDYTQINREHAALEEVDCAVEISNAREDLRNAVLESGAVITVGAMPVLHSSAVFFRRVVLNLIDNAIKYAKSGERPQISIVAERQDSLWHFIVRDLGLGISPENLMDVFAPFRRLQDDKEKRGHGIGLTSCRKIIDILGGEIWIESQAGIYTEVHFTLPAA